MSIRTRSKQLGIRRKNVKEKERRCYQGNMLKTEEIKWQKPEKTDENKKHLLKIGRRKIVEEKYIVNRETCGKQK